MARCVPCPPEALAYLKKKDKRLGAVIEQLGPIERAMDDDLFAALCHHIVAQQISNAALATVWARFLETVGEVTPAALLSAGSESLQACGLSFRKVDYLLGAAEAVESGALDLDAVAAMDDEDAIETLASLKGVGRWTAEMLLLFCLGRPDVLAFDDLAIQRGMRMVYRHRAIDADKFARYRRRLSPWGSVASLYFWAVAAGALEGVTDPGAPRTPKPRAPKATNENVRKSMQGNKGKGTKPELLVRERLRNAGLTGYRLQWKKAPGRPDVAWPGKKVAVFVNGCFWHRCPHCQLSKPRSHSEYWEEKFRKNQERDARNLAQLEQDGWRVHVVWECELKKKVRDETFARLLAELADELGKELPEAMPPSDAPEA